MRLRRQQHHGNWRWVVDFTDGRGKRRRRFFADRQDAYDFSVSVSHGKPSRRQGPTYSVRNLCDAYINATEARRYEASNQALIYKLTRTVRTLEGLGVGYAHEIRDNTLAQLQAAYETEGLAPHTVQNYLACFRSAVRYAQTRGAVSLDAAGLWQIKEADQVKQRHLSKEEIETLLGDLEGSALQLPVALGIYQGLRRAEVCRLRRTDLDVERGELTVRLSKTRRWRVIRIHPSLRPYLPEVPAGKDGLALCMNTLGRAWRGDHLGHAIRKRLDELGPTWADVSFHTLRHTCASQMAMSGKQTLYEIGKFLGHTTVKTTMKYAHLLPNQVQPDW